MTEMLVGYARVSTHKRDAQLQPDALLAAGVSPDRLYVDKELTASNRDLAIAAT